MAGDSLLESPLWEQLLLATAATGKARFVVANDDDLPEIPVARLAKFRFDIVPPWESLRRLPKWLVLSARTVASLREPHSVSGQGKER